MKGRQEKEGQVKGGRSKGGRVKDMGQVKGGHRIISYITPDHSTDHIAYTVHMKGGHQAGECPIPLWRSPRVEPPYLSRVILVAWLSLGVCHRTGGRTWEERQGGTRPQK